MNTFELLKQIGREMSIERAITGEFIEEFETLRNAIFRNYCNGFDEILENGLDRQSTVTLEDLDFLLSWTNRVQAQPKEEILFPEFPPPNWTKEKYRLARLVVAVLCESLSFTLADLAEENLQEVRGYSKDNQLEHFLIIANPTGKGKIPTEEINIILDQFLDVL